MRQAPMRASAAGDRFAGPDYRCRITPRPWSRPGLHPHRRDLEVISVIAQELGYTRAEDTLGALGEFGDHLSDRACCPEQADGLAGQDRRRVEVLGGDRVGQLL